MPTASIESAFPSDIESPPDEVIQKSIVIFRLSGKNDEENWMWGEQGHAVCVKTKISWFRNNGIGLY